MDNHEFLITGNSSKTRICFKYEARFGMNSYSSPDKLLYCRKE